MKNMDVNTFRRPLIASLALLSLAVLFVSTGCELPPESFEDDGVVEPTEPDLPELPTTPGEVDTGSTDEPSINLLFGGPPAGLEVNGGADNAEVLCFNIKSSHDVEIHKIRLRFEALSTEDYLGGRLVNNADNTANYTDIKFVGGAGGQVFFGPIDLLGAGSDQEQTVVFTDVQSIGANETLGLCVQVDVRGGLYAMNGDEIRVSLLPFGQGDIRFIDNTDFPVDHIDPQASLSSSFKVLVEETPCGSCELPSEEDVLDVRPTVSYASLPTSTLTNGTAVHGRITIIADAYQDIAVRQLTFVVRHSGVGINLSSNLREVGLGSYLDRTESTHCLAMPCNEYEVTLTLREDVWVVAGTSISFDLITTVWNVSSGDWVETYFKSDGELVSACELDDDGFNFSLSSTTPNIIWTDEAGFHHNGAGITPFGPMTLFAP